MNFQSSSGKYVTLELKLNRGGEGAIYSVRGSPGLVAKVYHKLPKPATQEKLWEMVTNRSAALSQITAWPTDVLYEPAQGSICGFLMRRVYGYKAILSLYSPRSRLVEFPNASWKFLIHTATNIARAFDLIHDNRHVVGDVNHSNIMVSAQGTAILIDCDSFQIRSRKKVFPCPVGVPTYTPPELQGVPLGKVTRSPNHDAFGLAVLIFHLLFMGRHPFSGQYAGTGDMPIEKAIKELRFAYGSRAARFDMSPPPGTLPVVAMPRIVMSLFERSFSGEDLDYRPSAHEWVDALMLLGRELLVCPDNTSHSFWRSLSDCPWCRLERSTGFAFFNRGQPQFVDKQPFDLGEVWSSILSVSAPTRSPESRMAPATTSREIRFVKRSRQLRFFIKVGVTACWLAFWLSGLVSGTLGLFGMLVLLLFDVRYGAARVNTFRKAAAARLETARFKLEALRATWEAHASRDGFETEFKKLHGAHHTYRRLDAIRQRKLRRLTTNAKESQLRQFLRHQRVEHARVSQVSSNHIAVLHSYGIETAWDVTRTAVARVPGLSPTLKRNLLAWRRTVAGCFVFIPRKEVDKSEIDRIEREVAILRGALQAQLREGRSKLLSIRAEILRVDGALRPELEKAIIAYESAKHDLATLERIF